MDLDPIEECINGTPTSPKSDNIVLEAGSAPEKSGSLNKNATRDDIEDRLGQSDCDHANKTSSQVSTVINGMGGHEAGDVVGNFTVRTAEQQFLSDATQAMADTTTPYQRWLDDGGYGR